MAFTLVTRVGSLTRNPIVLAELAKGFLRGVVASNVMTMREARRRGRPIPALYDATKRELVRFKPEPAGQRFEEFADVLTVLRRGYGDCDDLVAWRVAELIEGNGVRRENATIRIYWRRREPGQPLKMHAQVRRADGRIEDPSRFLGM